MLTHFYAAQETNRKIKPIVYKFESRKKRDQYVNTHEGSYPINAKTAMRSWTKIDYAYFSFEENMENYCNGGLNREK